MIETREEVKKEIIECECGTHHLEITHDVEFFEDTETNKTRVRQEFWLAMFSYGSINNKPSIWSRLRIIWNYLRTGQMHADQIILDANEAKKLAAFIEKYILETEN